MFVQCVKCNVYYNDCVWKKCPNCGGVGVENAKTTKNCESSLKEDVMPSNKKNAPAKKKRESRNSFEIIADLLDKIYDEYGGIDILGGDLLCRKGTHHLQYGRISLRKGVAAYFPGKPEDHQRL